MSLAIAAYISLCLGFVLGWVAAVVLIPIASDEAERGVGRRRPPRRH